MLEVKSFTYNFVHNLEPCSSNTKPQSLHRLQCKGVVRVESHVLYLS